MTLLINYSDKRNLLVIFVSTIAMGIAALAFLYQMDNYSLIYYGDATSHLIGARKFVDSTNPGIGQLGTVWLPLPHILFLPFSLIDSLFVNGMAGVFVNLPFHALSALFIYKIIKEQSKLAHIALIGGFLYASNPNLLYLGITSMTESSFLLFFIASAYFLQRWIKGIYSLQFERKSLVLTAVFVVMATLCRYEGWILAPIFSIIVIVLILLKYKKGHSAILISLLGFIGILLWLAWNQTTYGDPLQFANAPFYSAESQAIERPYRDMLYHNLPNDLTIFGMAAGMILGPVLLGMAALGVYYYVKGKNKIERGFLYFFLGLPTVFTVTSLYIGIGEMSQWWFNARFATFFVPLVLVLSSLSLVTFFSKIKKRYLIACIVSSMFAFQLLIPLFGAVTYLDAYYGWVYKQTPYAIRAAEVLKSEYNGGKVMIMTGSAQAHRIMQVSGIPLIQFDEMVESNLLKSSFKEPWLYDKWIVMSLEPDSDSQRAVDYWKENMQVLENHYYLVYENQYYKIFVIK